MAKLIEQTLVITISKMVKNDAPDTPALSPDIVAQLEAVVAELAGSDTIVEIQHA
jgi:hypothetical protein